MIFTQVALLIFQPATEEMEIAPSPPPPPPPAVNSTPAAFPSAGHQAIYAANNNLEENTITNICASNIILDVPEMTTRSRTGANKVSAPVAAIAPPSQTITKIIISKHMLQGGGQVVTVLPGGVRALQPTLVVSGASRQPPPLQQMQNAPPPPRLQQMAPAPPPLQAKPREGIAAGLSASITATPPPPLQIKIVPASLQGTEALPMIVPSTAAGSSTATSSAHSTPVVSVQVVNSADGPGNADEDEVTEVMPSEEVTKEIHS